MTAPSCTTNPEPDRSSSSSSCPSHQADEENGCSTSGNSFSHHNGEKKMTAPSCTNNPESDHRLIVTSCGDDAPVSSDVELVDNNDAPLACLYVAFFSSCGVLLHSFAGEVEVEPPTKRVLLYQMASLSVTAIIPTLVSVVTGIANNIGGTTSSVLAMGWVPFLLVVPIGVISNVEGQIPVVEEKS